MDMTATVLATLSSLTVSVQGAWSTPSSPAGSVGQNKVQGETTVPSAYNSTVSTVSFCTCPVPYDGHHFIDDLKEKRATRAKTQVGSGLPVVLLVLTHLILVLFIIVLLCLHCRHKRRFVIGKRHRTPLPSINTLKRVEAVPPGDENAAAQYIRMSSSADAGPGFNVTDVDASEKLKDDNMNKASGKGDTSEIPNYDNLMFNMDTKRPAVKSVYDNHKGGIYENVDAVLGKGQQ